MHHGCRILLECYEMGGSVSWFDLGLNVTDMQDSCLSVIFDGDKDTQLWLSADKDHIRV